MLHDVPAQVESLVCMQRPSGFSVKLFLFTIVLAFCHLLQKKAYFQKFSTIKQSFIAYEVFYKSCFYFDFNNNFKCLYPVYIKFVMKQ